MLTPSFLRFFPNLHVNDQRSGPLTLKQNHPIPDTFIRFGEINNGSGPACPIDPITRIPCNTFIDLWHQLELLPDELYHHVVPKTAEEREKQKLGSGMHGTVFPILLPGLPEHYALKVTTEKMDNPEFYDAPTVLHCPINLLPNVGHPISELGPDVQILNRLECQSLREQYFSALYRSKELTKMYLGFREPALDLVQKITLPESIAHPTAWRTQAETTCKLMEEIASWDQAAYREVAQNLATINQNGRVMDQIGDNFHYNPKAQRFVLLDLSKAPTFPNENTTVDLFNQMLGGKLDLDYGIRIFWLVKDPGLRKRMAEAATIILEKTRTAGKSANLKTHLRDADEDMSWLDAFLEIQKKTLPLQQTARLYHQTVVEQWFNRKAKKAPATQPLFNFFKWLSSPWNRQDS